jgi:type 1 fimbriae regulatory protein FimB
MKMIQKSAVVIGTVNRKHLNTDELAALIEAASGNRWSTRDQTMLAFCFRHGMRVSELCGLLWQDIDWAGKNVIIMRRKQRTASGTKANVHPLADDELKALRKLHSDYATDSDYVFATERRGEDGKFAGFTTSGFSKLLRRLEAKAGVNNFGPHALRHGRAQSLANAGHDAFLIRDALGHANVATSNAYVAASPERLRGVL